MNDVKMMDQTLLYQYQDHWTRIKSLLTFIEQHQDKKLYHGMVMDIFRKIVGGNVTKKAENVHFAAKMVIVAVDIRLKDFIS